MSITLYIGSGNWNTHLEGSSFFFFFFCFNHASFQQQIRIWGLFVFTIGVLKDSLWNVLLFLKRKLRPKLVWPGWANGDSPICILLGRTLTLCVEEQIGGGIAYTCVWELSGASAYEGFLLSGSDTGQRRFSHLGWPWCTPHGSHSQSVYPRWGLAAKSPVSSFLFPKLFSPAYRECSTFPNVDTPLLGNFLSWLVPQKQQKQNFWDLVICLGAATSHWHWIKDSFGQGEFKGRQAKKRFTWNWPFLWRSQRAFSIWEKMLNCFLQTWAFFAVTSTCPASFSDQDDWASGL